MSKTNNEKTVTLNEGREKSLIRRHPWVFSKAVLKADEKNNFLCYGLYSPESQIRVRAISFDENVKISESLISSRIEEAVSLRAHVISRGNDGVRLVSSEGDLLPGLIVDKYNEYLVISISSCGMERFFDTIVNTLKKLYPDCSIYERSDTQRTPSMLRKKVLYPFR